MCPQIISWNISSTVPTWLWPWYWGPKVKSFFMAQRRAETGPTDLETAPESWDSWNPRRTQGRGRKPGISVMAFLQLIYLCIIHVYIYIYIYM